MQVLFPVFVLGGHWVAVMLDITAREIIVLDPMSHKNDPMTLAEELKPLAYVLPHILMGSDYYNHVPRGPPQDIEWVVHIAARTIVPLQTDG